MSRFHIHVDAAELREDFRRYLLDHAGFLTTDFVGHPRGYAHFEPNHHLTFKSEAKREYRRVLNEILAYAEDSEAMDGYIEGEVIAFDRDLARRDYDGSVAEPFCLNVGSLPPASFRQTEIHITMSLEESNKELQQALLNMGFFCAYLPKPYGPAAIFTAQGSREVIDQIIPSTLAFLERTGGASKCSVKEERIAHWWISRPDFPLPPVVDSIRWSGNHES